MNFNVARTIIHTADFINETASKLFTSPNSTLCTVHLTVPSQMPTQTKQLGYTRVHRDKHTGKWHIISPTTPSATHAGLPPVHFTRIERHLPICHRSADNFSLRKIVVCFFLPLCWPKGHNLRRRSRRQGKNSNGFAGEPQIQTRKY